MDDELVRLSVAVSALAARGVGPAADAVLTARLQAVHRAVRQLQAVELALVREVDRAGLATRAGATSTTVWLTHRLLITPSTARRMVGLARALDTAPPALRAAMSAGMLRDDQAQAILGALDRIPAEAGADAVGRATAVMIGYARQFPAHQLARLGQRILEHVAPDIAERADREALRREERRAHRGRYLSFTPDGPYTVRVHGRLGVEAAAIIRAALDPLCHPRTRDPALAAAGRHPGQPHTATVTRRHRSRTGRAADDRTPGQRRADALVDICRLALAGGRLPDNGGDRPQVVLTVPYDPLTRTLGTGTLDTGDRLDPETTLRLACDAKILPAVIDPTGQPLTLGRERRLFTGPLRRALVLRDGGCAFPGCDRPPRWCDGHHIRHWTDGGPTALTNAVLLCGHHHRLIHSNTGWTVHMTRDGHPAFRPPAWLDPTRVPRRNPYHRRQ